jgi:hypothetical protein
MWMKAIPPVARRVFVGTAVVLSAAVLMWILLIFIGVV